MKWYFPFLLAILSGCVTARSPADQYTNRANAKPPILQKVEREAKANGVTIIEWHNPDVADIRNRRCYRFTGSHICK